MTRRAVFLDRDGVLNRAQIREGKPYPPSDVSQMDVLEGVPEALGDLRRAGFLLIVVSNQPDVPRGLQRREDAEAINLRLREELPIDDIRVCYHDDRDLCPCRKPQPGMLLDAAERWDIDLTRSFMIGDRWRDIEAGRNAGCRTILIDYGYQEELRSTPDFVAGSLIEAIPWILGLAF